MLLAGFAPPHDQVEEAKLVLEAHKALMQTFAAHSNAVSAWITNAEHTSAVRMNLEKAELPEQVEFWQKQLAQACVVIIPITAFYVC